MNASTIVRRLQLREAADLAEVPADTLRVGTTTFGARPTPSEGSIDLERLKVGTVRISNELVSVAIDACIDLPAHQADGEFETGAEAEHIGDPLTELLERILEANCGLSFEISVPRVTQSERRRRVLVRVTDVHDSSSSVGGAPAVTGAGSSTPDPTEGEPPSLADLADDLARVVAGLRLFAAAQASDAARGHEGGE